MTQRLSRGWIIFLVLDFLLCVAIVLVVLNKKG